MVLEKTLESPLVCKEIKLVHPKGNQPWIFIRRIDVCAHFGSTYAKIRTDAEAKAPILWPPEEKSQLIGKDPDAGKDWRQEKGMTEDEMVGWHHWLSGHEFQQTLGGGEGQEMLAWCCPWGCKELDITERLTTTDTCIHMAESFYRSPEMITTLLLGYKFSSVTQSCPILWVL